MEPSPFVPAEAWRRPLARLARGTILVVGAPGAGKSSLAAWLVGQLQRAVGRTALICADPGQAAVGVPGCLGLALTDPWEAPSAQWFVGDTSLRGHLLPVVVGTARLAARARQAGAQAVVVDAPGMVHDGAARALHHHLAVAIEADQVVALERAEELAALRGVLAGEGRRVLRFPASRLARDRSAEERRRFRERRFEAHFATATSRELPAELAVGTGWERGVGDAGPGTLAGLLDAQGYCLALGVLEAVAGEALRLRTPYAGAPAAVGRVQLGRLRLTPDAREAERSGAARVPNAADG